MNIDDYINYPMGHGSAVAMTTEAKNKMIEKFLVDENKIRVAWYKTNKSLVAHAEIPSHSTSGLYYDVIIEFFYAKEDLNKGNNIFNQEFRVYSNCPSFIYSYAYVFYQRKLICDWLINRYDKKTLVTPPSTRNQYGIIFYEQSIFFTLYYIYKNMDVSIRLLEESATAASFSTIRDRISSQNDVKSMAKEIHDAGKKEKEKLAKSKTPDRKASDNSPKQATAARGVSKPKSARGATKPTKAKKPF